MTRRSNTIGVFHFIVCCVSSVQAFYLPGAAPRDYARGDNVPLLVNTLTPHLSSKASLQSVISFDYYHPRLHTCQPEGGPKSQRESLGSILFGDRLFNSPFDIRMLQNTSCQSLCTQSVSGEDANFINNKIQQSYAVNWLVDGLPAAEMKLDERSGKVFYSAGFALGEASVSPPKLHNHYDIFLEYHVRDGRHRVVGALVWPKSVAAQAGHGAESCDHGPPLQLSESTSTSVKYTYSVTWTESTTPWATRWDHYLHIFDPRIHWFSLINSIIIAAFLCIMVGMVLLRAVSRDIGRYNAVDLAEDVQEDYGFKLVHGEVFRPPDRPILLSVAVGSGLQLLAMTSVTLVFALFGFLSPANRGSLSTAMIVVWVLCASIAGWASSRTYSTLDGNLWKQNAVLTATLFPCILFVALNIMNCFVLIASGSGAVPFGTMVAIILIWAFVCLPLSLLGSYLGLRKGPMSVPVRVNRIPRQIPKTVWYLGLWPSALLAGLLPWGAFFIECYFLLSSLFGSRAYAAAGFLFLTFSVVALTAATTTVLMCYFQLCQEDYRWHWRSFVTGGAASFWFVSYGLLYGATRLSLGNFTSKALYLGYLTVLGLGAFLILGSIGFVSTFFFLRRIYGSLRAVE